MKRELEIYIHIPFCVRKCSYCDFLSAPAGEEVRASYVDALRREIRTNRALAKEYEVSTVFLGGGTPSILEDSQLAGILEELKSCFLIRPQAEITVECNPGTLTRQKLSCYRQAGVNRLSLGLQSAQERELRILGRIHTWEEFRESFTLAREAGFSNINVDLMSGLPGQTRRSWQDTLYRVMELKPEHISAYSLILEEGTPLYARYGERQEPKDGEGGALPSGFLDQGGSEEAKPTRPACQRAEIAAEDKAPLPDEDTERQMYYDAKRLLEGAGFVRYEISNYARPGKECRHNLGYWQRKEYRGFGIGAASLLGDCRFRNTEDLKAYLQGDTQTREQEQLTFADILSETMFLGLRTSQGVRLTEELRRIYREVLERYLSGGFLEERAGFLRLTDRGIDVSNWILADFLLDEGEYKAEARDKL